VRVGGNRGSRTQLLITHEADVSALDKYKDAPLKKAAYNG
jgi:hypothetical protein